MVKKSKTVEENLKLKIMKLEIENPSIKELIIDFDLKHCSDVSKLIKEYIYYYNNIRPSYALKNKNPIQN